MSNHPSRSRSKRYGIDRQHAKPIRRGRGHGSLAPDYWQERARSPERRYLRGLRDLFRKTSKEES